MSLVKKLLNWHCGSSCDVKTPEKRSVGDLADYSQVDSCDISNIMHRYSGNLAELMAWRKGLKFGDDTIVPKDLLDAYQVMEKFHRSYGSFGLTPSELVQKIENGDMYVGEGGEISYKVDSKSNPANRIVRDEAIVQEKCEKVQEIKE